MIYAASFDSYCRNGSRSLSAQATCMATAQASSIGLFPGQPRAFVAQAFQLTTCKLLIFFVIVSTKTD